MRRDQVKANSSPLTTGRMSSRIVTRIQAAIDEGELTDGDRLPTERDLAEEFAVSRVTVRDALRVLEALGLIDVRVGASGGSFIRIPDTDIVGQGLHNLLSMSAVPSRDKGEARLAVEISTISLAIARGDDADVRALEELCDVHEERVAAGEFGGDFSARFHVRLAQASRNRALTLMTESFRGPLSMSSIREEDNTFDTERRTIAEHRAIADAVGRRDVRAAQRSMASHLLRNTTDEPEAHHIAEQMRG